MYRETHTHTHTHRLGDAAEGRKKGHTTLYDQKMNGNTITNSPRVKILGNMEGTHDSDNDPNVNELFVKYMIIHIHTHMT